MERRSPEAAAPPAALGGLGIVLPLLVAVLLVLLERTNPLPPTPNVLIRERVNPLSSNGLPVIIDDTGRVFNGLIGFLVLDVMSIAEDGRGRRRTLLVVVVMILALKLGVRILRVGAETPANDDVVLPPIDGRGGTIDSRRLIGALEELGSTDSRLVVLLLLAGAIDWRRLDHVDNVVAGVAIGRAGISIMELGRGRVPVRTIRVEVAEGGAAADRCRAV